MNSRPARLAAHPLDLRPFQESIGFMFQQEALLVRALTHPSVAHEQGAAVLHNQRLEFLGDAVLQLVLTHELYLRYPLLSEGVLTKSRATLVNERALADLARGLGLGRFLILSRGEELNDGRERPSALADAFEALLGAIYLDGGPEEARAFILRRFAGPLESIRERGAADNPKGDLQELLQASSSVAPEYRVASATGPDHDRLFECAVFHQGTELGRGFGKSKKAAEGEAAMAALRRIKATESAPAPGDPPPKP